MFAIAQVQAPRSEPEFRSCAGVHDYRARGMTHSRETSGREGKCRPSKRLAKRTTAIDRRLRKRSLAYSSNDRAHVRINPAVRQETRNSTFLLRCHLSVAAFYVTRRLRDLDAADIPFFFFSLFFFYFFRFSRSFRRAHAIFNAPTLDKNGSKSPGCLLVFRPARRSNDPRNE